MKIRNLQSIPVYPLVFAASSVLSLVAVNINEMEMGDGIRTLVVCLVVSALLLVLAKLCFRNWHKAAFFTFIVELVFISYGQVFDLLKKPVFGLDLAHHRYLIIASLIIIGLAIILSLRMKNPVRWTQTLNLMIGLFLLIPVYQIASAKISGLINTNKQTSQVATSQNNIHLEAKSNPDIYYIILDTYTRADALKNDYQFDNSAFLEKLKEMGFYVADCSRSNYSDTRLSLASSLNINYLQDLGLYSSSTLPKIGVLDPYIVHSLVETSLSTIGYQTVAFQTGYYFTDLKDAKYHFQTTSPQFFSPYLEPFEYLFLQDSAFRIVIDGNPDFIDRYILPLGIQGTEYVIRIQNMLKELTGVVDIPGPKFTFVHFDIPHHPFIFLPDGSINLDRSYYPSMLMPVGELRKEGYLNQVQYINNAIIPILQGIIANSRTPPIIVLQGDHGLEGRNRTQILNAILLPGKGKENLYPSISPVNTFRVIFNSYFGSDLPLLKDQSYSAGEQGKMDIKLVNETSPNCVGK